MILKNVSCHSAGDDCTGNPVYFLVGRKERIHVDFYGKCRHLYHTWILWVINHLYLPQKETILGVGIFLKRIFLLKNPAFLGSIRYFSGGVSFFFYPSTPSNSVSVVAI